MKEQRVAAFLREFQAWTQAQPDVLAVALVGSYARGAARPDSDVDLVIVTTDPTKYLSNESWASHFGQVERSRTEDYGKLTSLRVWYSGGIEVEYGITNEDWAAMPLDEGTRQVIAAGMKVLLEKGDLLSRHQRAR